ncbi:hypothetical protein Corgl_0383 [Coriobacterium glomerans PW2]|uniref:Uncharacterized protein n=1 Tax=Coriobacterium glomerans (strain ATCC 49209 / DSM 20642 / JCM 10262 / PW2) TaxID=700015 RepID=F2NAH5_CORGP|nr:hypothetical protein [Coriobacterium glomerans]AEB06502.1 hypothetical protein Corgl_0383 [Coriobacterium glomerans PW2]
MSRKRVTQDSIRSAARLASRCAGLIWPLMEGTWLPLLVAFPLLSFCYLRAVQLSGGRLSIFDLYVSAYSPSYGIPLLWLVCPIVSMVALARIWRIRDMCSITVRSGGRCRVWLARVADLCVLSGVSAMILHLSLLLVGAIFIGNPSDVGDASSRFAAATGGETIPGLSFPVASAIMLAYCFLTFLFQNSVFLLLRSLLGSLPAAIIVVVLAYPEVHKAQAFISDFVGTFGGDALAINPLSYLFDTASVYYPSWLPSGAHNLWFLGILIAVVIAAARLVCRRRDHL